MSAEGPLSLSIDVRKTLVTGLVFWRTGDVAAADRMVGQLRSMATWRGAGFVAAALLRAQDGSRVALYGQWISITDGQTALGLLADVASLRPSDSGLFELSAQLPEGVEPAIKSADLVALGEFWTSPEHQRDLIAREPAAAKIALAGGGIITANFHRSLDGTRIVNYAQIAAPEAVAKLAAKPGFDPASGYWREFARNEFHVYDVVCVIAADA